MSGKPENFRRGLTGSLVRDEMSVKKSLQTVDDIPPLGNELKNAYKTSTRARSSGG